MRYGFSLSLSRPLIAAALPPVTGNVLPTDALNDKAFSRAAYGDSAFYASNGASLPAGDWVIAMPFKLPTSDAYDTPLLSIYNSPTSTGYMGNAPGLYLIFPQKSSSQSIDPARGALILTGRDDAGNWLCPQTNRSISTYFGGANVPYIAGPTEGTPDGIAQWVYLQKKDGRITMWIVRDGHMAIAHDSTPTNFGVLTANQCRVGVHPNGTRASTATFQRLFIAAGSLTPRQMEAIAQGVDPRKYLPFDQPGDLLTNWQALGTNPNLVGTGSFDLSSASSGPYSVQATPIVPNTVIADMPRMAFLERGRVVQRQGSGPLYDMRAVFRATGFDDDIYVEIIDATNRATSIVSVQKVGTTVSGDLASAIIRNMPSQLGQYLDVKLRKGLNGTPVTLMRSFQLGVVTDGAGQSIEEEDRTNGSYTIPSSSPAFNNVSFYSNSKSTAGSTQGYYRRGWVRSNSGGYGETRYAQVLAETLGCAVGLAMSAVKGSGIDAWARGSNSGYEPMMDTWRRIEPGYLVYEQGQGSTAVSYANYQAFLTTFEQQLREDAPQPFSLIIGPLNANGASPASSQGVFTTLRTAQSDWATAREAMTGSKVYNLGSMNDVKMYDGIHPSPDAGGRGKMAERKAWQIAYINGLKSTSAVGPRITGVTRNGAVLDVKVAHNGGTALRTPYTGDITGFEVSADNFATRLAFASSPVIVDATTIRITLANDPGGSVKLRYQQGNPGQTISTDANGYLVAVSNPVYDDRTPAINGATIGFPLMFTSTDLVAV